MIVKLIGPGGTLEGLAAELMRIFKLQRPNYTITVNKGDEKYHPSLYRLAEELNSDITNPNFYMAVEFIILHEPWGG